MKQKVKCLLAWVLTLAMCLGLPQGTLAAEFTSGDSVTFVSEEFTDESADTQVETDALEEIQTEPESSMEQDDSENAAEELEEDSAGEVLLETEELASEEATVSGISVSEANSENPEETQEVDSAEEIAEAEESEEESQEELSAGETESAQADPFGDGTASGTVEVTRGQWLHELVAAMDISVEEDEYPDNYFTDLTSDHTYYADIMAAIDYGMIDVNYGGEFNPDGAASREFAAHTANFCLNFEADSTEYTYSDSDNCTYPADIQVAVNRGWFALSDGAFLPELDITEAEMTTIINDVTTVQESTNVSSANSDWVFADYVVEVPWGKEVSIDENDVVTIANCPVTINEGDTFVVWPADLPRMYVAETVTVTDGVTTITTSEADADAGVVSVNASGTADVDMVDFEAADGVGIEYISTQAEAEAAIEEYGFDVTKDSVVLTKKVEISKGVSVSVACNLSNLEWVHNISNNYAYVALMGNTSVTATLSGNLEDASDETSIELGSASIAGVGKVRLYLELALDGKVTLTTTGKFTTGFEYQSGDFRLVSSYSKTGFSAGAEASGSFGVKSQFDANLLVVSATVYARTGVAAKLVADVYTDGQKPTTCVNINAWLYVQVGAEAKVFGKSFSKTKDLISAKNNGCYVSYHYEDNKQVSSCSRGKNYDNGSFYTPADSRYGSSSYGDGSSTGIGSNGETYTIYTYDLDDDDQATITGYQGNASVLSIPKTIDGYTVVGIGEEVFKGNTLLKVVILPETVTEIQGGAFYECTNLNTIDIPDSLIKIGSKAFAGCKNLSTISFPDSVTSIGSWAFENCEKLTGITLPPNLTTLGTRAFYNCDRLTTINIPKGIDTIPGYFGWDYDYGAVFEECDNLKEISFDLNIKEIPRILNRCESITSITIPDTVKKIDESAFSYCTNLNSVIVPDSVTTIESKAFAGCTSLPTISLPNSVTSIGTAAFADCTNMTEITLPPNLTTLGSWAFYNCDGLTSINIPRGIEDVPGYLYTSGGIANMAWHYGEVFIYCDNLKKITFDNRISELPRILNTCTSIEEITLPDTLIKIDDYAFENCSSLQKIEIPGSVTTLGSNVFSNCTSLIEINLPDSIISMGSYEFYNCTSLKTVKLPNTRKNITSYMFAGCTSLDNITLPDTVTYIREFAFQSCTSLKEVTWSKSIIEIDDYAFNNCDALTEFTIPSTVTYLGEGAFYGCDGLIKIVIPDSVSSFGSEMFYDCDALTDVVLGTGITSIPESTFEHCDVLESIALPYRVTSIKKNAFKDCVKFNSITIPRKTESIDSKAFGYPENLTIYGVSGTYAETFATENSIAFVSQEINATNVVLSQTELTLNNRETVMLTMSVTPSNFTDEVTWKSTDTSVAKISDNGVIEAKSAGSTTIKLTVGNVSATCTVTVVQPVTSINLNKSSLTLESLETYQLTASARPENAANREVVWSSSDENVATVGSTGLVTAVGKGTATITVKATDGSEVSETCRVTVSNTAYVVTAVADLESAHNYENDCSDFWVYQIEGATALKVTFDAQTNVEENFDYLYIYDKDENEIGKYTGTTLAGQNVTVSGDTVRIKLVSDDSGNTWGFKVTDVTEVAGGTVIPSTAPTAAPTVTSAATPTVAPTTVPTIKPTSVPTTAPTAEPTAVPTTTPTPVPTSVPATSVTPTPLATPVLKLNASGTLPLKKNQKLTKLKVTEMAEGDYVVSWTSSNPKIVKVSGKADGTCKLTAGKKTGTATITITLKSGLTKKIKVKVQKTKVATKKITGVPSKLTLEKGKSEKLSVTLNPISSTDKITYKTSNKKVATVSSKGIITAKKKGTATITIKAGKKTKKIKVTVK